MLGEGENAKQYQEELSMTEAALGVGWGRPKNERIQKAGRGRAICGLICSPPPLLSISQAGHKYVRATIQKQIRGEEYGLREDERASSLPRRPKKPHLHFFAPHKYSSSSSAAAGREGGNGGRFSQDVSLFLAAAVPPSACVSVSRGITLS